MSSAPGFLAAVVSGLAPFGLHLAGGFTQGIGLVGFRLLGTDEHGGDQEGDGGGGDDGEQHPDQEAFGVISSTAKMEPGEAGETRPALNRVRVKTPVMPPAITARMRRGFIST